MSFVAVAVGLGAVSVVSGIKAGRDQRKAGKAQRKADRLQSWQNQMQQLRDYQMAVAQSGSAWQGSGVSLDSSGARATRSAAGSQLAHTLDMLGQGAQLSNQYASAMNSANRWQGIGAIAGTLSSVAMGVGSITAQPTTTPTTTSAGGQSTIRGTGGTVWDSNTGSYVPPRLGGGP